MMAEKLTPAALRSAVRSALQAGALTSIAGTTSYIAILVTAIVFASTGSEAADLRSLFVPLTLLFGGLSLLLSVPAQIAGARGSYYPGGNKPRQWGVWTIGICVLFCALFAICWIVLSTFGSGLLTGIPDPRAGAAFLSFMALGYLPFATSDFIEGYLRGSGRFLMSSSLVVTRAVITCASYALGISVFNLRPLSLPVFYAIGGVTTFLLGGVYVIRSSRKNKTPADDVPKVQMRRLVLGVGLPVLASYILLSTVVSFQIAGVELGLGRVAQYAFSALLMVQSLCVVAAIGVSAGVSSELLGRVARTSLSRPAIGAIVARTSTLIFAAEALVLALFLCFHDQALDIFFAGIHTSSEIRVGAIVVVIAALLTANNVFVLTVLEEIGLAALSLVLNAIYFVLLIGVTYWSALVAGTFLAVGIGLLALSVVATIGVRILLTRLPGSADIT